jgi:hypothetical protein
MPLTLGLVNSDVRIFIQSPAITPPLSAQDYGRESVLPSQSGIYQPGRVRGSSQIPPNAPLRPLPIEQG